jgi:hypothetical protein
MTRVARDGVRTDLDRGCEHRRSGHEQHLDRQRAPDVLGVARAVALREQPTRACAEQERRERHER